MSISMQNDINALKAKITELESKLSVALEQLDAKALAEWQALVVQRVKAIEARLGGKPRV